MSVTAAFWRHALARRAHRVPAAVIVGIAFLVTDGLCQAVGGSVLLEGPLDELAHLLTMLLVLWAMGPRLCERFLVPALITSVAIDLDHVPQYLHSGLLTAGTPRPYGHSLLSVAVVLVVGAVWEKRRDLCLGVALALVIHFWRDMGEPGTGVALFWPFSYHAFSLPHTSYLIVMLALIVANSLWRPVPKPLSLTEARND